MHASPRSAWWWSFIASLLAGLLSAGVLLSQTLPRRSVRYVSALPAPPDTTPRDFLPPPTPLQRQQARAATGGLLISAVESARGAVPPLPWNEHGLARVAISAEGIRWDEARGRYIHPLEGDRVAVLTLERPLQQGLEAFVARYQEPAEASVVLEAATGRVLAMVDDHTGPLIGPGLARRSWAWAASTFKVITGAALLGEGVVTLNDRVCFSGGWSGFSLQQLAARETGGRCDNLRAAMASSSNLVFGRMADDHLTPATLQAWAERFGYNARIPFEMDVQPSRARIPEDRLEFGRAAAGFRHSRLSPLHGAMIQAAIGNDGRMMVPTIVASIEDASGRTVWEHTPVLWRTVMEGRALEQLQQTLADTCTSGTASRYFAQRPAWPATLQVLGKTGTLSDDGLRQNGDHPRLIFTWFTGYAQVGDRTLAVSGLVANAELWWIKGSQVAAEALLAAHR